MVQVIRCQLLAKKGIKKAVGQLKSQWSHHSGPAFIEKGFKRQLKLCRQGLQVVHRFRVRHWTQWEHSFEIMSVSPRTDGSFLLVQADSCTTCALWLTTWWTLSSCSFRAARYWSQAVMDEPAYVIVYQGQGHQSLRIPSVGLSVTGLVHHLEHFSDWLWGVGDSYKLVEVDSPEWHIGWNHVFPVDRSVELRLIYIPNRITSEGFPCHLCLKFVSWGNTLWHTVYNKEWLPLPHSEQERFCKFLYQPRYFFCSECGPLSHRLFFGVDDVYTDPITSVKVYTSWRIFYPSFRRWCMSRLVAIMRRMSLVRV